MKKKTCAKSAMAELLQKSNETQTKEKNIKASDNKIRGRAGALNEKLRPAVSKSGFVNNGTSLNVKKASESEAKRRADIKRRLAMQEERRKRELSSAKKEIKPRESSAVKKEKARAKTSSGVFKRLPRRFFVYASASAFVLCLIAAFAVIIMNIPVNAVELDGALGNTPLAADKLESFDVSDSDDTAHDGRFYVTVNIFEGAETLLSTASRTVGDILAEMNIAVGEGYLLRENEADIISSDASVNIDRITYGTVEVSENIPFETKYVDVKTVPKGKTAVAKNGANGVRTAYYNVTYVNGVETERVFTEEKITKYPVDQVVNRGVGGTFTVGGKTYSYSYYIDCKTTVYTGGGTTASGLPATEAVIAVDPKVIKLGTKVYVEDPYCYVGFRTAADTGGSIKGNFIDIYFDEDNPSLWGYGIRRARVYILD